MSRFAFRVESFRRLENPLDRTKRHCHVVVVEARQLPTGLMDWRRVNVRGVNLKTAAAREMLNTIATDPDQFLFRNRGVVVIAKSVRFDNQDHRLTLELDNKHIHGIVDGGHTFTALLHSIDTTDPEAVWKPVYVKMEILTGFTELDEVVDIVEGRNTGTAVPIECIMNLTGAFNRIQTILEDKPYAKLIAYHQFQTFEDEKCPISIKDILSYLICFDIDRFDDERHPHQVYGSGRKVFEYFERHQDRLLGLLPLLPDILELRDTIHLELPEIYNRQGGYFGPVPGVKGGAGVKVNKRTPLHFIGQTSAYKIPISHILPIIAAFRPFVTHKDGGYAWADGSKPIHAWAKARERMVRRFRSIVTASEYQGPNRACKNPETWRTMYDTLQLALLQAK